MPELEKTSLLYKFGDTLTKLTQSDNPVLKKLSDSVVKSIKTINKSTIKNQNIKLKNTQDELERKEVIKKDIKNIIKKTIATYIDNCSKQFEKECSNDKTIEFDDCLTKKGIVIILIDTILRLTSYVETTDNLILLNNYINRVVKLACNMSNEDKNSLIQEYTNLLKESPIDRTNKINDIFKKLNKNFLPIPILLESDLQTSDETSDETPDETSDETSDEIPDETSDYKVTSAHNTQDDSDNKSINSEYSSDFFIRPTLTSKD